MGVMAKYYKCALQVNSFSYAKYRGDAPEEEEKYNEEIVEHCKKNNISVVGLADHGSVDASVSLRKKLENAGVTVFPGFEISTAEKIHIVCLFPPNYDNSKLNRIIGGLGLSNADKGTEISKETCLSIADRVEENRGFWYAAHITSDSGILKLKAANVWKSDKLVAAQIPASMTEIDPNYKNIIGNTDPNYQRNHPIAYINASDVEYPEDLDKDQTSVLIKMSTPNFENFCMAFKDPESRIRLNSEKESSYQSSIDFVKISGGYLDGLSLDLSDNLATIIGGRGTGKSTLIASIQYALGLKPVGKEAEKDFNRMIDNNFGNGSVIEIVVTSNTQYGQKFHITKRFNQTPVITNENGEVIPLTIQEILPSIEIYGQNEIMEIARDDSKIREVATRLFSIDETATKNTHKLIVENGRAISEIENRLSKANDSLDRLPTIQTKLKYYQDAGVAEKLTLFERLSKEEGQFDSILNAIPQKTAKFNKIEIGDYDNEELKELANEITSVNEEIDELNNRYAKIIMSVQETYHVHKENWETKKRQYDSKLKESLQSMEGIQDKSSNEIVKDYMELVKESEKCKPLKDQHDVFERERKKLSENRLTLIENYKKACDERDHKLALSIKKINKKKLKGKVQISISPRQNKRVLIEYLVNNVNGVGPKSLSGIEEYKGFDVFTFANDCQEGKEKLKSKYQLTTSTAEKIVNHLDNNAIRTIEEMILDDAVEIELAVNDHFKPLKDLSKGQQCTAILNLLLLDNKDPLIVDQPEDNLDNSFIADNLVSTLRENKIKRQYILATHNANIPVFGDAEQIITLEESAGNGRIVDGGIGSIDDSKVRDKVISILEGGRNAFKMREEKYGIK